MSLRWIAWPRPSACAEFILKYSCSEIHRQSISPRDTGRAEKGHKSSQQRCVLHEAKFKRSTVQELCAGVKNRTSPDTRLPLRNPRHASPGAGGLFSAQTRRPEELRYSRYGGTAQAGLVVGEPSLRLCSVSPRFGPGSARIFIRISLTAGILGIILSLFLMPFSQRDVFLSIYGVL